MRRITIGALVCITGLASIAHAQTWPDDADWRALYCGGVPAFDPRADEPSATNERDVVGDAGHPAAFIFADAEYVYLRLRVDADPASGTDLRSFGWAVELDIDAVPQTYEVIAMVDGIASPDEVVLSRNTQTQLPNDPADRPEQTITTYPASTSTRAMLAEGRFDSSFGGDADYFVDWAISLDDLAAEGVTAGTELALTLGTSSSAQSIDADVMCSDASLGGATLTAVFTDATRPDGVVVVDTDGDGLSDAQEVVIGTRPDARDSDGDGFDDGTEVRAATDPNDANSVPPQGTGLGLRGGPGGWCAVGHGGSSWWPALALALIALRRRRR